MTKSGLAIICSTLLVGACSDGLTQVQDAVTKFDQGAHSAANNEISFLLAVQAADCANQFYTTSGNWALGDQHTTNFDISGTCKPSILTDAQINIRQSLMSAVALYADKMAALAADDTTGLDKNSEALAGSLNQQAANHQFVKDGIAADVEAAVIGIANMVIDRTKYKDLQKTAHDMGPQLCKVAEALETENTIFAVGVSSKSDGIEGELRQVIVTAHKQRGAESFFDVIEARNILTAVNPFSTAPKAAAPPAAAPTDAAKPKSPAPPSVQTCLAGTISVGPTSDSSAAVNTTPSSSSTPDPKKLAADDPQNIANQLNSTLESMLNANDAIEKGATGGIIASVNDLVARAQAARSIQTTLAK